MAMPPDPRIFSSGNSGAKIESKRGLNAPILGPPRPFILFIAPLDFANSPPFLSLPFLLAIERAFQLNRTSTVTLDKLYVQLVRQVSMEEEEDENFQVKTEMFEKSLLYYFEKEATKKENFGNKLKHTRIPAKLITIHKYRSTKLSHSR